MGQQQSQTYTRGCAWEGRLQGFITRVLGQVTLGQIAPEPIPVPENQRSLCARSSPSLGLRGRAEGNAG